MLLPCTSESHCEIHRVTRRLKPIDDICKTEKPPVVRKRLQSL